MSNILSLVLGVAIGMFLMYAIMQTYSPTLPYGDYDVIVAENIKLNNRNMQLYLILGQCSESNSQLVSLNLKLRDNLDVLKMILEGRKP
jgi:hypothetical protein